MNGDRKHAERALDRVVTEARAERSPELDWARIEARLDEAPRMPDAAGPPLRGFHPALLLAAAAVLLVVGWVAAGGRTPIALQTEPDATPRALDGDRIAGAPVDASSGDVNVEHAGRAQWTLERGGRARVTHGSGAVRVELERGAILARVVPSPRKETFVVEAAGTRVAVHGTAFRVVLEQDRLDVSVSEGVVLVGPRAHPGSGQSLTANQRSTFTLSGAPLGSEARAREPSSPPAADRRMPSANRPRELPVQPSIEEVEKAMSQVFELGATCFQSRTATADGVRVTASTTLTLRALPNGRLELASLEPPLAPQVQGCVVEGIKKLGIAESQAGIQVTRRLELER